MTISPAQATTPALGNWLCASRAAHYRDMELPTASKPDCSKDTQGVFHHLRVVGNKATHEGDGNHAVALTALKISRELGIWSHKTFGAGKSFSPGIRDDKNAREVVRVRMRRKLARIEELSSDVKLVRK